MDVYEYQVIMNRIKEIEQEQLQWLNYTCENLDYTIEVQKENVRDRMLRLKKEKIYFLNYLASTQ